MQNETKFKEKVLRDLKKIPQCYVLKTQERARKGVPDLLVCLRGKFIAIELKVDGEEPEEIQRVTLEKIQSADGLAFWSTPSRWAAHHRMLKTL